ncbi:hypothetical protein K1719_046481 [Acacia pycnantha]|nr:hypothetical protein K1719_046481 [Acacia pycnantha]
MPKDWQAKLELEDSIDSAKMQRAEPLPPPQILTVFLVALDEDTENRIMDQLPPSQYRCVGISLFNLALNLLEKADLNEDSSSRVSSQQKSLKRENDQQPSEKERESSKRPRIVWHKALLDLLVNTGDDKYEGTSWASDEGTSWVSDGRTSWASTETKEKEKKKKLHQTPTIDSPPQAHVVCQQQIQHEHHEQHLPCQPMHNSGVTSLIGNGVNNLTSMPQPDGITFDILQQPDIAPDLTSATWNAAIRRTSNMQQPGTQQLGAKVW